MTATGVPITFSEPGFEGTIHGGIVQCIGSTMLPQLNTGLPAQLSCTTLSVGASTTCTVENNIFLVTGATVVLSPAAGIPATVTGCATTNAAIVATPAGGTLPMVTVVPTPFGPSNAGPPATVQATLNGSAVVPANACAFTVTGPLPPGIPASSNVGTETVSLAAGTPCGSEVTENTTVFVPNGTGVIVVPAASTSFFPATASGTESAGFVRCGAATATPQATNLGLPAQESCPVALPGSTIVCTIRTNALQLTGDVVTVTLTSPPGATVTGCASATPGVVATSPGGTLPVFTQTAGGIQTSAPTQAAASSGTTVAANQCAFTVIGSTPPAIPAGSVLGTQSIAIPAATQPGAEVNQIDNVSRSVSSALFPFQSSPIMVDGPGPTGAPTEVAASFLSGTISGGIVPAISSNGNSTVTKFCAPASAAAPSMLTCTLTFTAPAGMPFGSPTGPVPFLVISDTILAPNATFSLPGTTVLPSGTIVVGAGGTSVTATGGISICQNGTGTGGVVSATGGVFVCVLPPIVTTGPSSLTETVATSQGGLTANFANVTPPPPLLRPAGLLTTPLGLTGATTLAPQNATNCTGTSFFPTVSTVSAFTCQFTTLATVPAGGGLTLTITGGTGGIVAATAGGCTGGTPAAAPVNSLTLSCPGGLGVGSTVTVSVSGFFGTSTIPGSSTFPAPSAITVTYLAPTPVTSALGAVCPTAALVGNTCTVVIPSNGSATSATVTLGTNTAGQTLTITAATPAGPCPVSSALPTAATSPVSVTYTCGAGTAIPPGASVTLTYNASVVGAPATATVTLTSATTVFATQVVTLVFPLAAQPSTATLSCSGATTNGTNTFSLPLLASTGVVCTITPKTAAGTTPVADGTFTVTMQNGGNLGVLNCTGASSGCTVANNGQTVNLPCGNTAPAGTTPSVSCTSAAFGIASIFSSLLASPTSGLSLSGLTAGGSITVMITFTATPGNGGTVGGINLGNFTFTLAPIGTGILLVNAIPALIPSNGTSASAITATFATGTTNPFGAFLSGGAFLPGTFTFVSGGPVIFDNGRSSETVPCGVSAANSGFGVNGGNAFGAFNTISPVLFSCQGAAVLAIGSGSAGDAPINVTYQSSVGNFQAVGSTLVTVVPAGAPKIALSCTPTTITNTGGAGSASTCIASVTDLNGIPLSGITGANVTFTVSDPTRAIVAACQLAASAATGIGTVTPCALSSAQIPTSSSTFLSGQAAAVVTAITGAAPSAVTVTATLGAFTPPAFACLLGQTNPPVSLAGQTNCGQVLSIGGSGLALSLSQNALGFGGLVTLPNATSASQSLTISAASTTTVTVSGSPVSLTTGCNQVVVSTTSGTAIGKIVAAVSPSSAVVSVWRFNNATKTFQSGFFSAAGAPTDFSTTSGGSEVYFVCVSGAATITSA